MREIIFRAWDGKKLSIGKAEYFDDSVNFRFEHFDIDCDKPILEQYTGLKDKNGTMIFEGDDVRMYDNERLTFQVNFNDRKCGFYVGADQLLASDSQNIEIIGNIHDKEEDV